MTAFLRTKTRVPHCVCSAIQKGLHRRGGYVFLWKRFGLGACLFSEPWYGYLVIEEVDVGFRQGCELADYTNSIIMVSRRLGH